MGKSLLAARVAMIVAALAGVSLPQAAIALPHANQAPPTVNATRLERIGSRLRAASQELCTAALSCATWGDRLIVTAGGDLNAWADGRTVWVTTRMMRFADKDDELAFVVSHEMAHNLLGHAALQRAATKAGWDPSARAEQARQLEIAADGLAVDLLRTAGFDTALAAPFIMRCMRGRREHSRTHPGTLGRIAALRLATSRLSHRRM